MKKTDIKTIEELKGKTIVSSGQGGTPEYALQAVLKAHGLEMGKDVKVEWLANHSDVNTRLLKTAVFAPCHGDQFPTRGSKP